MASGPLALLTLAIDSVYLDHAGATLYSKSLIDRFSADLLGNLLGNPHSASTPSQYTTSRIEDVRLRLLDHFNADPEDFDLVFVANATAGIKLVSEAFRSLPNGFHFAYHEACHTSIVGVREEALSNVCVDDNQVQNWISGEGIFSKSESPRPDVLFAYTAQSHMDGRRYPLSWPALLRKSAPSTRGPYVLLDVASLAATSSLDLGHSDSAPDFTVLSLYKLFGFPDLGALIVRKQAQSVFDYRRYFGGGTVDMVVSDKERWHSPKAAFLHERLEDGTLPFHNILALDAAFDVHADLFGSMASVASHTSFLTRRLFDGLAALRHDNGQPVAAIYSRQCDSLGTGPVVSFNLRNSTGAWISLHEFEKLAALKNFHIRTGGVCSPGGIASALDLKPWEMRRNFSSGFRCGTDQDVVFGKPTGVIRASLGAMSTVSDVDSFLTFLEEFYQEKAPVVREDLARRTVASCDELQVKGIKVYPIKSCGAYCVPNDTYWEVRPEGLAWDREWCLIHQGTGQALSQKRYPRMALFRPRLDFDRGLLRVSYRGKKPGNLPDEVCVPLSADPTQFDSRAFLRGKSSRVCGDKVTTLAYASSHLNRFFSEILEVPCVLARFPAGGEGLGVRHSKAKLQEHQQIKTATPKVCPGAFPELPSPPDSDSEQPPGKILLSNESPILLINTASVEALNRDIAAGGGRSVPEEAFRANVIVGTPAEKSTTSGAWAEDNWSGLVIGDAEFRLMGSCRRCQMVCIDQDSGERGQEPFVTLAKTRRFDGKVYFGTHMEHEPCQVSATATKHALCPIIRVGDSVRVKETA
ncbi:Molybdenum cofactor sulfurase [Colletotrichum spinosum]|uniref:Molybdenum cofactor sulfurase n=1 Tax=Colletotrichum spinosum TaxID=1347390 RepID=A0A4R8PU34_9PEZI|nr:Molybdenum cofactor sulfurase [Colletotrichum spinosum]